MAIKKSITFRGKRYHYMYKTGKPRPLAWYMNDKGKYVSRVIKEK